MNDKLIQFILNHEREDVDKLVLKHKEIQGYPVSFVADQIIGRRKAKDKLPTWYANQKIVYPPQQNLEQSSSEATAEFKAQVIKLENPGEVLADLTGGFGVDTFFLSRIFNSVWYVEPNPELIELVRSNHTELNATNIRYHQSTAEEFLKTERKLDWIYIDPSRKKSGRKVFKLDECEPNVLAILPDLFSKTKNVLIKTSPWLDLKDGLKQLKHTRKIFVVSVDNDCKEILFLLQANFSGSPKVSCVNLPGNKFFEFSFDEEESGKVLFSEPQQFIYEPNASILKAGAFKTIAVRTGLNKIASNTHLYTGEWIDNFPGRVFKIEETLQDVKQQVPGGMINVMSRNHPLSPDQIKKKFKLKDGGERYLLAFSGVRKKYIVLANRLQ